MQIVVPIWLACAVIGAVMDGLAGCLTALPPKPFEPM